MMTKSKITRSQLEIKIKEIDDTRKLMYRFFKENKVLIRKNGLYLDILKSVSIWEDMADLFEIIRDDTDS